MDVGSVSGSGEVKALERKEVQEKEEVKEQEQVQEQKAQEAPKELPEGVGKALDAEA